MNLGMAFAIFEQIGSDKYTNLEKGEAIRQVVEMPTHNGVTKDKMLKVIAYLWDLCFEIEGGEEVKR